MLSLSDLRSTYTADDLAQVEFCASRNSVQHGLMYVYMYKAVQFASKLRHTGT